MGIVHPASCAGRRYHEHVTDGVRLRLELEGHIHESRVVPGTGLTITRADFVRALMIEDLPTLGRPTMASFSGASVVGGLRSAASPASSPPSSLTTGDGY